MDALQSGSHSIATFSLAFCKGPRAPSSWFDETIWTRATRQPETKYTRQRRSTKRRVVFRQSDCGCCFKDLLGTALRWPKTGCIELRPERCAFFQTLKSPDMRDPRRPIERVHVDDEMAGVLPRWLDRLLPASESWRQATRLKPFNYPQVQHR